MAANCLVRLFKFFDWTFVVAISSAIFYCAAFVTSLKSPFLILMVPVLWTVLIGQNFHYKACLNDYSIQSLSAVLRSANCCTVLKNRCVFYLKIWIAGVSFWLLPFIWLRFATAWANILWIILAFAIALYWVIFIGLSRLAVHRLGIPIIIATPIVWCGLAWTQKNYLLGGFSAASLEHALYENITIIQFADLFGEYGVGMFVVFIGACVGRLLVTPEQTNRLRPSVFVLIDTKIFAVASCALVFIMVVAYGNNRLTSMKEQNATCVTSPKAKIALLQGNIENGADINDEMLARALPQLQQLSRQAASKVDLVVWPESNANLVLYDFQPGLVPEGWENQPKDAIEGMIQETLLSNHAPLTDLAKEAQTRLLLGVVTLSYEQSRKTADVSIFKKNSAVLIDPGNTIGPRYDKINLAPFIERNPLSCCIPERYTFPSRFAAGHRIPAFPINAHRDLSRKSQRSIAEEPLSSPPPLLAAVNICFDSTLPHFIRRQVRTLTEEGREPDVLINISNDGFFRFTDMVEMHLATHVFRAIENRKPYLTAANAGSSAWIDNTGRIIAKGEKGIATFIIAEVYRQPTTSFYLFWGDWLPICCVCFNVLLIVWWCYKKVFATQRLLDQSGACS